MTFEELDALYENGLVDAEISKISIDYENRSAEFRLRRNPASSPDAEVYSEAILRITTFCYVSIDPPDDHHAEFARRRIQFNALNEDPSTFPLLAAIGAKVHPDAFVCRFFVHDWNSFIHLAAHDANLSRRVVSCDKYSESTRPPLPATRLIRAAAASPLTIASPQIAPAHSQSSQIIPRCESASTRIHPSPPPDTLLIALQSVRSHRHNRYVRSR